MNRRGFIFGASLVALTLASGPALAANGPIIDLVKAPDGSYSWNGVDWDALDSSKKDAASRAVRKTLAAAQAQNKSLSQANGMVTKVLRGVLGRTWPGMIVQVLGLGLSIASIALQNGAINFSPAGMERTMSAPASCSGLPPPPASLLDLPQGVTITRNSVSSCNGAFAYQRFTTTATSYSAPAGWTRSRFVSIGGGQSDVIISRNYANGASINFPALPIENLQHALQAGESVPATEIDKILDPAIKAALASSEAFPTAPSPFLADPGSIALGTVPSLSDAPSVGIPSGQVGTAASPIFSGAPADAPGVLMPASDAAFFPGAPSTGGGGTTPPGGTTTVDWGTPPGNESIVEPAPMSWVPTPFTAPSLPGSCEGVAVNFPSLNFSGSINPCPVIDTARPIIRPVATAGWTVAALRILLDI